MEKLQSLRQHVARMLHGGQAFDTFEAIITDFPSDRRGVVPPRVEHSAWQILEHMRIAQRDILDFIRVLNSNSEYLVEKTTPPSRPSSTLQKFRLRRLSARIVYNYKRGRGLTEFSIGACRFWERVVGTSDFGLQNL